jgi:hypothetical protein
MVWGYAIGMHHHRRVYNTIYDATYYLLAGILLVTLAATAFVGRKAGRASSDHGLARAGRGVGWAASGLVIVLVTGVVAAFVSPVTGDLVGHQLRFTLFYVGFALVLGGMERLAWPLGSGSPTYRWRWLGRAALGASIVFAATFLLDHASYTASRGRVAQQTVFYLPLVVVLLIGLVLPLVLAAREPGDRALRRARLWFGAFSGLALVGVLREATVIPTSGEPLVDLLVAFGPLVMAGFCLALSEWSLYRALRAGVV